MYFNFRVFRKEEPKRELIQVMESKPFGKKFIRLEILPFDGNISLLKNLKTTSDAERVYGKNSNLLKRSHPLLYSYSGDDEITQMEDPGQQVIKNCEVSDTIIQSSTGSRGNSSAVHSSTFEIKVAPYIRISFSKYIFVYETYCVLYQNTYQKRDPQLIRQWISEGLELVKHLIKYPVKLHPIPTKPEPPKELARELLSHSELENIANSFKNQFK